MPQMYLDSFSTLLIVYNLRIPYVYIYFEVSQNKHLELVVFLGPQVEFLYSCPQGLLLYYCTFPSITVLVDQTTIA